MEATFWDRRAHYGLCSCYPSRFILTFFLVFLAASLCWSSGLPSVATAGPAETAGGAGESLGEVYSNRLLPAASATAAEQNRHLAEPRSDYREDLRLLGADQRRRRRQLRSYHGAAEGSSGDGQAGDAYGYGYNRTPHSMARKPPPPRPPRPPPSPWPPQPAPSGPSAAAFTLVGAAGYSPFGLVNVTTGRGKKRRSISIVVACGGGGGGGDVTEAPSAAAALQKCTPVCAAGFGVEEAGLVCRNVASGGGSGGGWGGGKAGTAVKVVGSKPLKWAAERPSLTALTCPSGGAAADASDCIAYLTSGGCATLATIRCSAGPAPRPPPALPPICSQVEDRVRAHLSELARVNSARVLEGQEVLPTQEWMRGDLARHRTDVPHGTVRLLNGPVPGQAGVVQISYCGYWGSVSMNGTQVSYLPGRQLGQVNGSRVANALRAAAICSSLGFPRGRYKRGSQRYGGGTGVVWAMAPVCQLGVEAPLAAALADSYVMGGKRYNTSALQVPSGACPSWELGVSAEGHDRDLSLECWRVSPAELQPPPYVPQPGDLPDGSLRIMNHTREAWYTATGNSGYVQVWKRGKWGTICSRGWDADDAATACMQMGYDTGSALQLKYDVTLPNDAAGSRWRTMWMTDVNCPKPPTASARRRQLIDCPHRAAPITDCPFTELAAVRCFANAARAPRAPPPPPPSPPASPDSCRTCLLLDLTMEPPVGGNMPYMGPAMCTAFANTATAVVKALDRERSPPRPPAPVADGPRPPPPPPFSNDTLYGFDSPGFEVDLKEGPIPSLGLPVPFSCTNITDRTMTVCGAMGSAGWDPVRGGGNGGGGGGGGMAAAEALWTALMAQSNSSIINWLRKLRNEVGLLQPCQAFDADYDYQMMGLRMTPDVRVSFCPASRLPPVIYFGMDGVNTLVRTVWTSPPPDAPWAARSDDDGWEPPEEDVGSGTSPRPPPRPSPPKPPPPRPRPPPAPAPSSGAGGNNGPAPRAAYRGCYSLVSNSSNPATAPGANVSAVAVLINVTTSGLNLTLEACAMRARASNYSQFAVEGYSGLVGGSIRVTAICYGLLWPVPVVSGSSNSSGQTSGSTNATSGGSSNSVALGTAGRLGLQLQEQPAARCTAVPCAAASTQRPPCGTGRPGGLVLYDIVLQPPL